MILVVTRFLIWHKAIENIKYNNLIKNIVLFLIQLEEKIQF